MRSLARHRVAAVLMWAVAGPAVAAEYQSVGGGPAVFYDAPTLRGTKVWVAPRGMPLEVIVAQGDWARVRDSTGGLAWVERKALVPRRSVVVKPGVVVDVHASADDASPVVFRVQPGVLLDLAGPAAAGWVGVRHADGQAGFARIGGVWGV